MINAHEYYFIRTVNPSIHNETDVINGFHIPNFFFVGLKNLARIYRQKSVLHIYGIHDNRAVAASVEGFQFIDNVTFAMNYTSIQNSECK